MYVKRENAKSAGKISLEKSNWRWHGKADNPSANGGSKPKLLYARRQRDPLHHMEHYMKKRKLWQQAWKDTLVHKYQAALATAASSLEPIAKSR